MPSGLAESQQCVLLLGSGILDNLLDVPTNFFFFNSRFPSFIFF